MMTDLKKMNFILNKKPYRSSNIIVAGDNFGCGSSREHAPWALVRFWYKMYYFNFLC